MVSIVVDLHDFITLERITEIVSLIEDKVGSEEEVREIRIEE